MEKERTVKRQQKIRKTKNSESREKVQQLSEQNQIKNIKEVKEIKEVKDSKEEKMYVIPLGGLDEVGKNMNLVQYRDEIIIIDCGVGFPGEGLLGIDLVIPDFSYVENNKNKIKGLFVTHGHEDHIGSIPYLYQKIDKEVSIFSGKLTLALIEGKFENLKMRDLPKM